MGRSAPRSVTSSPPGILHIDQAVRPITNRLPHRPSLSTCLPTPDFSRPLFDEKANRCTIEEERCRLTSGHKDEGASAAAPGPHEHRILLGDQRCPRCHKFFTMSYWSGETMVQARCLSCDLKWPRPDVV